jgi:hypothetical protein
MKHLLSAARESVLQRNWYSALSMALTFPDVCGSLEDPSKGSTARYVEWFTTYMAPKYCFTMYGGRVEQFLSGEDCYALRCAFLHQGSMEISGQRIQDALDAFFIITPPPNKNVIHMNKSGRRLQLQVDCFVEELCTGVESWLAAKAADPTIVARIEALGRIHDASNGIKI